MATYANTTNPFIKTSTNQNSIDRAKQKKAPGMAKPQSSCGDQKDINLLLNDDNSLQTQASTPGEPSDDCNYDQNHNAKIDRENNVVDSRLCLDADILRATENLVESVIRLELEETGNGSNDEQFEKKSAIIKKVEFSNLNNEKFCNTQEANDYVNDNDDEDDDREADFEQAPMEHDSRQHQHIELIKKLRLQLRDLERYAYERGELDGEVPPSVIAERQTVILDTLKDKLSLSISSDEIGKLELNELKLQVDKEIHDLINPITTKEHLLSQLKTQLTDLERYIAHLHGTIGKNIDKKGCLCHIHGCSSSSSKANRESNIADKTRNFSGGLFSGTSLIDNEALPKTSRLIRSLVTQLICSDIKLQESAKRERENQDRLSESRSSSRTTSPQQDGGGNIVKKQPFDDQAAWTLHIDKVVLATDSLVNLYTLEHQYQKPVDKHIDDNLVESIVRRQLTPALRDILSYGLLDPDSFQHSTSYASILFNPYYLLTSLTCFPTLKQSSNEPEVNSSVEKNHVWNVIEDYYNSRNEPEFKTSSIKTLSQSFNLAPSISGPIKITSKQALLIAIDDIIETLSKCKPNGPESHFRAFTYTALNRTKLSTWMRLIFKNRSVIKRFYHNFSFVSQPDKMDKLLAIIEVLNQFEFKLRTDVESIEQFVNAF